jgi:predicted RNase H-like nuclease (RuvC/YqgF family)
MFVDIPQNLLLIIAGAFLLGWLLSSISSMMSARSRASKRDPRDDRIRELEAAVRISKTDAEKSQAKIEQLEAKNAELEEGIERRDNVISEQQAKLEKTGIDLRESVLKTRELRAELSERATENVKSEAKLREVETELSVAQASTDLLATGVLDYSLAPKSEDDGEDEVDGDLSYSAS